MTHEDQVKALSKTFTVASASVYFRGGDLSIYFQRSNKELELLVSGVQRPTFTCTEPGAGQLGAAEATGQGSKAVAIAILAVGLIRGEELTDDTYFLVLVKKGGQ